jgi:hypothetical protein
VGIGRRVVCRGWGMVKGISQYAVGVYCTKLGKSNFVVSTYPIITKLCPLDLFSPRPGDVAMLPF